MSDYILYPLIALGGLFIVCWIYNSIKAAKDPDVKAATNLRMTITRYNLYKKLYEEHQESMRIHGFNSKEANEKFMEIFKQIPNPNEWRRFCDYQGKLQRDEMQKELDKYLG